MIHNLSEREQKILQLLMDGKDSSVTAMSEMLGVSQVTTRSILSGLSEKGLLVRTWGGAIPAIHPDIMNHARANEEEKRRIAQAASSLVDEGDTIMIEAGTTTALVASYLLGRRVTAVTNSMLVVPYARANPAMQLTVVGGEYRPATESMVGPIALRQLAAFHVKYAFVGTDGFSLEHGLSTHLPEGAEVVRTMASRAAQTVLVADSTKWGRKGFVSVLPLSEVDVLVSDSALREAWSEEARELFEDGRRRLITA